MRDVPPRPRFGFSLIELLVVIAIIGILVSLLMSAVQQARGAANRIACANNLHQVAIAVHLYQSDNGAFPPAAVWDFDNTGGPPTKPGAKPPYVRRGMWPSLLPYVDEGNVNFDYSSQWNYGATNTAAIAADVKTFRCPASPGPKFVGTQTNPIATTDFAPLAGASGQLQGLKQSHGPTQSFDTVGNIYPGFFNNLNKSTETVTDFGDITDGTSNTIMIVEDAGRNDLWIGKQKNTTAALADEDNPDTQTFAAGKTTGGPWAQPRNQVIVFGFNSASQQLNGTDFINACNAGEVYSFHPNVANFAFGDGSVRTLTQRIDPDVFISLVTRAGGEPISPP